MGPEFTDLASPMPLLIPSGTSPQGHGVSQNALEQYWHGKKNMGFEVNFNALQFNNFNALQFNTVLYLQGFCFVLFRFTSVKW